MAQIKGITHAGEVIEADAPGVAHLVDMDDHPSADLLIASVRDLAARNGGIGVAHMAVEGVAVPISPDDTETPAEKRARLLEAGVVLSPNVVTTTQGVKTVEEIGTSGLGVDPNKAPNDPPSDPPTSTPDELLLIEGLGKDIADKLIGGDIRSRVQLAARTDAELDGIVGIGPKTIEEIRAFLERTAPTE